MGPQEKSFGEAAKSLNMPLSGLGGMRSTEYHSSCLMDHVVVAAAAAATTTTTTLGVVNNDAIISTPDYDRKRSYRQCFCSYKI